jgi:hypothetical protein
MWLEDLWLWWLSSVSFTLPFGRPQSIFWTNVPQKKQYMLYIHSVTCDIWNHLNVLVPSPNVTFIRLKRGEILLCAWGLYGWFSNKLIVGTWHYDLVISVSKCLGTYLLLACEGRYIHDSRRLHLTVKSLTFVLSLTNDIILDASAHRVFFYVCCLLICSLSLSPSYKRRFSDSSVHTVG